MSYVSTIFFSNFEMIIIFKNVCTYWIFKGLGEMNGIFKVRRVKYLRYLNNILKCFNI